MYKITKTTTDYNGVERTEDYLFNLTKAELLEMEMSTNGGLDTMIKRLVASQDGPEILRLFKDIVLKSYGVKSDDGKRFIKNDRLREEFSQTEAYSEIFMDLATNEKAASEFINGIVPSDLPRETPATLANK